jgi:hypothetical protein
MKEIRFLSIASTIHNAQRERTITNQIFRSKGESPSTLSEDAAAM